MLRILLALAILVAAGCTYIDTHVGRDFTPQAMALSASDDALTVDHVLAALGPPQRLSALADGYAFLYQYFYIQERQLGIGSDQPYLRWLKLSLADTDADGVAAVFHFSADGMLLSHGIQSTRADIGEGGAIMFALAYAPIVETNQLTEDLLGPEHWGMGLLVAPGVSVAPEDSLDYGSVGVELRGTPSDVGQRTLESQ